MSKPAWAQPYRQRAIYIGYEPREANAFAVARFSIERRMIQPIPVHGLVLGHLKDSGLYYRPHSIRDGQRWDEISEAPFATEFSNSRFLVPHLAQRGWALFMDCDMLVRGNIDRLFEACDGEKAVMVVKHHYDPPEGMKMDGVMQTRYAKKNWSSVMAFNLEHPANKALTVDLVNSVPGRDLHAFCWLEDENLIGELDPKWNFLVGHHDKTLIDPVVVHFTQGIPSMPGFEFCDFADEWYAEMAAWAS